MSRSAMSIIGRPSASARSRATLPADSPWRTRYRRDGQIALVTGLAYPDRRGGERDGSAAEGGGDAGGEGEGLLATGAGPDLALMVDDVGADLRHQCLLARRQPGEIRRVE